MRLVVLRPPNKVRCCATRGDPGDVQGGGTLQAKSSALAPSGQKLSERGDGPGGHRGLQMRPLLQPSLPCYGRGGKVLRAPACAVSSIGVVPALGSPQAPGAGRGASATRAAGRGQCSAAREQAAASCCIWFLQLGFVHTNLPGLFIHHYLRSHLAGSHIFPGSPRLSLPSKDRKDACTPP